jgi:DNA-binding transcriptional LysR family regulator
MNHRQIEAFRAVVQLGSMTNAADLLGISQPAVSRLIRDLESHLGLRLFRREGNRLLPTHEALVLFEEVDLHYRGFARIQRVASDLRRQSAGSLRIAAPHSLATFFLTDVTSRFLAEQPSVGVSIASFHSTLISERVALRQYDLGLVQILGDHPGVTVASLPPPPAVCIVPKDHPIAGHDVLTPHLLADQSFISLGPSSPLRARIDALFGELSIERRQIIEADLASTVCALVSRGLGVSIVDPFAASAMDRQNVVARPFEPTIPFDVAVVVPAHRSLSAHAQRFLDLIKIQFRSTS